MTRPSTRDNRARQPDQGFVCCNCDRSVAAQAPGTEHRNHCPHCLFSMHVDMVTGDRRSGCRGPMEPVAVATARGGEWALLHRCRRCGLIRLNRVCGDDNPLLLVSMALRPIANPPFPLAGLECTGIGAAGEADA